jgi:hypothetical protein
MSCRGHIRRMGEKMNAYKILVEKLDGKRPLGGKDFQRTTRNYITDDRTLQWPLILLSVVLTNYLHGAEPFLRSSQSLSYSGISQYFTEPEGSLSCSQKPSNFTHPEPDQSSPYHSILSKIHFSIIPSSMSTFS